jgi:ferric-dicitrate binding protein FerR (iron transport regulator)
MNYTDFSAADLAKDEYFQHWVSYTEDERVDLFWRSWLAEHPEKRSEVEEARNLLSGIRFENYALTDDDLSRLWCSIHQLEGRKIHRRRVSLPTVVKLAAAAVLVLTVSVFYFLDQTKPYRVYRTSFGETKTFTLPDGSSVALNANSRLTIKSDWRNERSRDIWLTGEGFFSVIHKTDDQPFKVHTDEVTVEVLGTTFNVYNRTSGTKVVLNSGQIRLSLTTQNAPEEIVMSPGEMIEYYAKHYEKKAVDPDQYSAWMNHRIILDHTSLAEMVHMLEDNYGLEVSVKDKTLLSQTVSGSMPLGDANVLMQQLGKAFRLKILRSGTSVVIEEQP